MERRAFRVPGFVMLLVLFVEGLVTLALLIQSGQDRNGPAVALVGILGTLAFVVLLTGFTILSPNEARVVQFFGRYADTINQAGLHWTVPFSTKRRLSLRIRNFESAKLKVSDADGNPVEIAAVVVWRVFDTAKAAFAVNDHVAYVAVQAEAAVRHLATMYPYEAHDSGRSSLRERPW